LFSGVTDYVIVLTEEQLRNSKTLERVQNDFKRKPSIVNIEWLIDSMEKGEPIEIKEDTKEYLIDMSSFSA